MYRIARARRRGAVLDGGVAGQERDHARRLARAIQQALQWIHSHTAEEIARQVPAAFHGGDLGGYVLALSNSKGMYSPDGRMTHEAASSVYRGLAASVATVRTAQFDLSATYTNKFVAA